MLFEPPRLYRGGHRQTLAGALLRRAPQLPVKRVSIPSAYDDHLTIDVLVPGGWTGGRLLLLHGLTGNSQASPLPQIARRSAQLGVETWCLNFRGADGRTPSIPRLYHAGCSDDLEAVFCRLPQDKPWVVAGFSLGANVLLKWLGEGPSIAPRAAMAVSCPFDLQACSTHLEADFLARCYRFVLMQNLKKLARAFLGHYPDWKPSYPVEHWTSFYDIDQHLTAPLHGFHSAYDYWDRCSSSPFLDRITTPTVILHAQDDPFQPNPPVHIQNPFLKWELPDSGGHLGFIQGPGQDWLVERVARYAEDVTRE